MLNEESTHSTNLSSFQLLTPCFHLLLHLLTTLSLNVLPFLSSGSDLLTTKLLNLSSPFLGYFFMSFVLCSSGSAAETIVIKLQQQQLSFLLVLLVLIVGQDGDGETGDWKDDAEVDLVVESVAGSEQEDEVGKGDDGENASDRMLLAVD